MNGQGQEPAFDVIHRLPLRRRAPGRLANMDEGAGAGISGAGAWASRGRRGGRGDSDGGGEGIAWIGMKSENPTALA